MTVRTIEYLLDRFGPGDSPRSSDYIDLIETLADDRNAVYISATEPADVEANPMWFDTTDGSLKVYSNSQWNSISEGVPAGGTSGQVLSKASGDDYDTAWVSPANLPFVTYAKDSDQNVSGAIVTFPTSSSLSGGSSFGSMASTGVFTFSETGNYLITISFNTSATGTSGYADLDIWGRVNGSDAQRYTQVATNAVKKGSVSEVVPITAANDTFEWYSYNGCTVYGSGGTKTRINIVKLN